MSEPKSIKIGMFGGGGVGKTCITLRYLKGEFTEGYIPTIEDEFSKVVEIDNQSVSLSVIDTAGQDDFSEMRHSYFSRVQGFVFVMDISNKKSIDDLKKIYDDAKETAEDMVCVIAANKCDLRKERDDLVPEEDCKNLGSELQCHVYETSAKENKNIDVLFVDVVRQLLKNDQPQENTSGKTNKSSDKESGGEGGCCLIA